MSQQRKFLHDTINKLAIAQGRARVLIKKIKQEDAAIDPQDMLKMLEQVHNAVTAATELCKSRQRELSDEQEDTAS